VEIPYDYRDCSLVSVSSSGEIIHGLSGPEGEMLNDRELRRAHAVAKKPASPGFNKPDCLRQCAERRHTSLDLPVAVRKHSGAEHDQGRCSISARWHAG
jgi:hypothetical protein